MVQAYTNLYARCGLEAISVEADSGAIGGKDSHEFMIIAETGEDEIIYCVSCNYAANAEKATSAKSPNPNEDLLPVEEVSTPGVKSIDEVAGFLNISSNKTLKAVIYTADEELVFVTIRGDFDINHLFTVPQGARFTAKVGFIQGATATDGVRFYVSFTDSYGIMHDFPSSGHLARYDGVLDELNLDLSSIAGKQGYFSLGVNSAGTSAQDWAVWVDPKIIN